MVAYGFTDVMYDGSKLPLAENIANTKRVVEAAHAAGVSVEAELGHVGMGDQYDSLGGQGIGFTDPESAEHFVKETGVDFLAIAFGTSIMNTAAENMRRAADGPEATMFDISEGIRAVYSQWCGDLYEVFGVARRV